MRLFVMRVLSEQSGDDWLVAFKASRHPDPEDYFQLLKDCGRFYEEDLEQNEGPGICGTNLHVTEIIEITKDEPMISLPRLKSKK